MVSCMAGEESKALAKELEVEAPKEAVGTVAAGKEVVGAAAAGKEVQHLTPE